MNTEQQLHARSGSACELCGAGDGLTVYAVPPHTEDNASVDQSLLLCATCCGLITDDNITINANHWRCLNDSMWSQLPAVQVMVWRILTQLRHEGWPQELLDMLFLDDATQAWAEDNSGNNTATAQETHRDSNGAVLATGDTVTLIKDLKVKGANFTAKRGTAVRGISLVADNSDHIEGRVNGQRIVILTQFVKKSGS